MDVELSGCLGDVQIILEETIDGLQGVLIQGLNGILLEHLVQEHFAEGGGKLIDDAAQTQVFIVDDGLLAFKDPAHIDGDLSFLVAIRQLPQMPGGGAYADDAADAKLLMQRVLDAAGHLFDFVQIIRIQQGFDDNHVGLVDVQHKVLLLIREETPDHFHSSHVGVVHLAHQKHDPGLIRDKMQFLGPNVHVTGQNVVRNDIFDESSLVVLFLKIVLGFAESHCRHGAYRAGHAVRPFHEGGKIHLAALGIKGTEAAVFLRNRQPVGLLQVKAVKVVQAGADHRKLACRDNETLFIHDADGPIYRVLHLNNHVLENPAGHIISSCEQRSKPIWSNCQTPA